MKRTLTTMIATAILMGLGATMGQAAEQVCTEETVGWETVIDAPGSPALYETVVHPAVYESVLVSEAVYETVLISEAIYQTVEISPATYELEFEYVHPNNPNHPGSPRWEAEGWNAEGSPNSGGWVATGNVRQGALITEAVYGEVLVKEAVYGEVLVKEATWADSLVTPEITETVLVSPAQDPVTRQVAVKEMRCQEVIEPVTLTVQAAANDHPINTSVVAATSTESVVAVPAAQHVASTSVEASLANTGTSANLILAGGLGFGLLVAGAAAVRRSAK